MWHIEQNDVVNSEITLLLSKESKRLQILQSFVRAKSKKKIHTLSKIDFANDRIYILGKEILLHFATSEHYAILLNNINLNLKASSLEDSKFVEVLLITDNNGGKMKKEKYIANKLHKQFGHPKSARLVSVIKTAGRSCTKVQCCSHYSFEAKIDY